MFNTICRDFTLLKFDFSRDKTETNPLLCFKEWEGGLSCCPDGTEVQSEEGPDGSQVEPPGRGTIR